MIFDYETLKMIWWVFMGILLIGFAVTGGFDMGVGALLPFLGRTDEERRVVINAVGPTWEGNQTWLITAAGASFAAWPLVYATVFSGFYTVMVLTLFALFLRPVGFDYRSKVEDPRWRTAWDWSLAVGGAVPAFIFGVTFGNLLQGVPFHFDEVLRVTYTGSFGALLNPFALLCGVVSLAMVVMHGGFYLQTRIEGPLVLRAEKASQVAAWVLVVAFALGGLWVALGIEGYRIISMPDPGGAIAPLAKTVERAPGAWLDNYSRFEWMWIAPAFGLMGPLVANALAQRGLFSLGFWTSAAAVTGVIATAGMSMFPFILPSSSQPNASLTVWDAVSSHATLQIMFWVVVVLLPLVLVYTRWVYRVLGGKVSVKTVMENKHQMY